MYHKNGAHQGYNVSMNVKGLPKDNMPRVADIMILKSDNSLKRCAVQVRNHPG